MQQINTLPIRPKAIVTDPAGNIYIAGTNAGIGAPADLPALHGYRNRPIVASADGGVTWTSIGDLPTKSMVRSIAADPRSSVVLVTTYDGIWKTTDIGTHWRRVLTTAFPNDQASVAFDPAVPGHTLSSSYYSTDGGESWFPQMGNRGSGRYASDPRGNGTVLEPGNPTYPCTNMGGGFVLLT